MRVSIREDDLGYATYVNIRRAGRDPVIFLDEVEQKSVITADDEAGTVYRHVLDAEGRAQIDPEKTDEVWCETVTGVVRIETR
jgi:hypothetical protein